MIIKPTHPPLINFHSYQKKWLADKSRFKVGMFARQTGKTLVNCTEIVDDCLVNEIKDKRTRWVILSRGERQAKEAMDEYVKPFCKSFYMIYNDLLKSKDPPEFYEDTFKGSYGASYKSLEVAFPGGSRITALPANPDTARGFSANVLLDEFGHHRNSREIWKAVFPVISKGFKIRVAGTPNGKGNKFHEIMTEIEGPWSKHIVDIYQAVAAGLDRNIEELRAGLNDEDAWQQEYELKWLDSASAWLSYELISSVEHIDAGDPSKYQGGICMIGNDIAARNDLWVAWVWELVGDVWWAREIRTLRRASFKTHDMVMDELMLKYRVAKLIIDQTGMGEKPVEDAKARYGNSRVEGVLFTSASKQFMATNAKEVFEDGRCRIPANNPELRADLHKLKKVIGPTGIPRFIANSDGAGHADRLWAAFLGLMLINDGFCQYDYTPVNSGNNSNNFGFKRGQLW